MCFGRASHGEDDIQPPRKSRSNHDQRAENPSTSNLTKKLMPQRFVQADDLHLGIPENPPSYISMAEAILSAAKEAQQIIPQFDRLAEFKTVVIVEETYRLPAPVKNAIMCVASTLLALSKAYQVNCLLYFMNYVNQTPGILGRSEQADLACLIGLLEFEGFGALKEEILDGLTRLRDKELFSQLQKEMKALDKNYKLTPDQKLEGAHDTIRNMVYTLSPGWNFTKNMEVNGFLDLYTEAHSANKARAAKINPLPSTIDQALTRAEQDYKSAIEKGQDPTPTKVIILAGSELSETAYNKILKRLKTVEGRASDFSIIVAYFGNGNNTSRVNQLRNIILDNKNKSWNDVFDAVFLNAHKILEWGLGAELFVKLLFSHIHEIDTRKVSDKDWYGRQRFELGPDGIGSLPTSEQFAHWLIINLDMTERAFGADLPNGRKQSERITKTSEALETGEISGDARNASGTTN